MSSEGVKSLLVTPKYTSYQPVRTRDPYAPYATGKTRPSSAPVRRPTGPVDVRPAWHDSRAELNHAKRRNFTISLRHNPIESRVSKRAPYAARKYDSIDLADIKHYPRVENGNTVTAPPYSSLNDPHLVDYFARKFGFQPKPPTAGSVRSRTGSAIGPGGGKIIVYKVDVKTADRKNAGTDANVFIWIKGTKGKMPKKKLCKMTSVKKNAKIESGVPFKFTRGKTKSFKLKSQDLGDLTSLRIEHDGLEKRCGWFLEEVVITNLISGKSWLFPCNQWLSLFEADCQLSRELKAYDGKKYGKTEYEVVTITGNVKGAGTDANVYVTMYGQRGTSSKKHLRPEGADAFERGQTDICRFKSNNVGMIRKIRIEHDNTGFGPGWFLERVVITDLRNPKKAKFYFPCGQWLAKDEGDRLTYKDLLGSTDPMAVRKANKYIVRVYTGDRAKAGTDANVSITIFGEFGDCGEKKLRAKGNNFERGSEDKFILECPHLGELKKIRIGHDNAGLGPGWFLDKVIIDDSEQKRCYEFPCHRWFDKREDDGQIQRDILVGGKPGDAPAGFPYEFRVTTSDKRHAGTSARIYVIMYGGERGEENSGKVWLNDGKFERGRTDICNVECATMLSPLSRLTIGHDNSGPGSGWHLEKVEVYCPATGITQTFVCDKWLADDESDGCIERTMNESESMRKVKKAKNIWHVTVHTGDQTAAGTDSKVMLCLYGSKGKSDDIVLNNASDNFEKGNVDSFKIEVPDVGKPYKIRIGHDNAGAFAGWFLKQVTMENMSTKKKYIFNCNRWFAKDEDDGCVVREIPAEGETIKKPQPLVKYNVSVVTSDKFGAGTDANVFCVLYGDQGDTGERPLVKSEHINKFERGDTDTFEIEAVMLKKLRRVKIFHDGSWAGAGWHLDKVIVEEQNNPKSKIVFPCNRWLDRDEDDGLIVRELVPEGVSQLLSTTSYHVTVKTGEERNAGTDANVYLKMFGELGDSGQLPLKQSENTKNKFEKGRKDKFVLEACDIGKLEYIKIGHDGSGPGSGWFLDSVEIDIPSNGLNYMFAAHRWLAESEGDGEIEVELQITEMKEFSPRIPYEITVITGDKSGAGTDAQVFIRMYGLKGKTDEFILNNRTDNFERGMTDKFKIEAADVAMLTKIRIGHDNSGRSAGWYLERVIIERFPPKRKMKRKRSGTPRRRGEYDEEDYDDIPETNVVNFVCNRWFAKDEEDHQIVRELLPTDEEGRALKGHGLNYNEYIVHIFTGDVSGAGTDSNVFINLFGEMGDSGERELKESETNRNKFEKNSEDVFRIEAVELGNLKKLKIRHDDSMLGSAWFLDRVEIEDTQNKERYYFPCQRWLATKEDDGQISRDLVPVDRRIMESKMKGMGDKRKSSTGLRDSLALETKAIMTTYYIAVETANVRGAGTDADVYVVLYGESDDTGLIQLKTSKTNKNKFERGKVDKFEIEAVDIGEIKKLKIGHNNGGAGPGWMLEKVDIDAPSLGKKWTFPCHRWFDKKEDDGLIERELYPVETRTEEYEKHVPYEITVHTTDKSGAGTDADVYIVLFGKDTCTSQKSLCSNKKQRKECFERNKVDKFVVEMEDVGDTIEKIRIGHDDSGFGAAWHLHKVEVRRLLDKGKGSKIFTFPCGRWLARKEDDGSIVRELVPTHIVEEVTRKDGSVKTKQVKQATLEKRVYKVNVVTGDVKGAGTDANVFINVFGEYGDTGERKLVKSETHMDKFEKGQTDKFTLEAVDLGKIYKMTIRHDNSMLSPAWFLDKVEIIDDENDVVTFHCERWLAKNKDNGKIERTLYIKGYQGDTSSMSTLARSGSSRSLKSVRSAFGPDSPSARRKTAGAQEPEYFGPTIPYTVKITTGKDSDMGTEANVFIEIIGSKKPKTSGKIPLEIYNKSKFEPKSTETFSLEAPDMGEIKKIELGHDGITPKDGWFVEDLEIDMPTVGKHYHFPCKRWFSKDKDDGLISRTLFVADAESVQYKPKIPYEMTIYTGDVKSAGTDSKVTLTVFGANGKAPDLVVDKNGDRFERGKADMIKLELEDIAPLKKIRISIDGKGSRPDWYLEKILMRNMDTGDLTAFHCDQWLSKSMGDGKLTREISATVRGETLVKTTFYTVNVKTSNVRGAGTDSNVFLILFGENGDSGELALKESATNKNKFENNQLDVFKFEMLSLGDLLKCRVWHDNKGWGAAWHLEYIEVIDEKTHANYMFHCNRWLAKNEDDKQIMRELTCSGPATPGREDDKIAYNITIVTGDKNSAGTQHNVWVILEGDKRSSKEFLMENSAKNKIFRRGDTDDFKFNTRNVGEIDTILLGHRERYDLKAKGSGRDVEWYCYEIIVQNTISGDKYVFPCKSWIPLSDSKKGAKRLECTKKEKGRADVIRNLAPVKYEIVVTTGDEKGSGTNANVFITLYGEYGDSGKRPLTQRFRDLFERKQVDKFQIEALDLGELIKCRVEHDNSGFSPGWFLDKIEVTNQSTGMRTLFPAQKWLDKKKGDGEIFKELFPHQE